MNGSPPEAKRPGGDAPELPGRYGRAQFLADAAWMGLDVDSAFSRADLRRQRDRMMNTHHPDRGGAESAAARVNETYARMVGWLDRRRFRRDGYEPRGTSVGAPEAAEDAPKRGGSAFAAAVQSRAVQLYALAAMAAAGYTMFRRRR